MKIMDISKRFTKLLDHELFKPNLLLAPLLILQQSVSLNQTTQYLSHNVHWNLSYHTRTTR